MEPQTAYRLEIAARIAGVIIGVLLWMYAIRWFL